MPAAPAERPLAVAHPLATVARLPSIGPAESAAPPAERQPAPASPLSNKFPPVLRSALAADDATVVRQRLLDGLASLFGAERVAIGWRATSASKWQGTISGQGPLEPKSESGRALAAAFAETALSRDPRQWNPDSTVPLTYHLLAALMGARSITGIPLAQPGHPAAAVLLLFNPSCNEPCTFAAMQAEIAPALTGLLRLCDEAAPSRFRTIRRTLGAYVAGRRKLLCLVAVAALAAIAAFPVADRVSCTATLEPSVRRFVGAPFDGKLEKALVKVGDAVVAGQTVAVLDKRPLEIELSVHQAQLEEAARRRDAARAKGQAAQTQLAELEVAQIERQVEQLEHQLEQLTIVSPITGIVVRGELQRVEGAPLSRGQNLFEIAPLSPLIAELAIPEDEVRLVARGASAEIRPLALPGSTLAASIDQIHPRAELRDGQTVFIAELALANDDGQLRPGMQARAVVYGPRQPLVWTLVRRPFTRLYRALWW
jgi:RND family efflux transporter MFP subunit